MKRAIAICALVLAICFDAGSQVRRGSTTITVVAGTPQRVSASPILVRKVLIEMKSGGTGIGYVMAGIENGRTPDADDDSAVELYPATSTAPGGAYSDEDKIGNAPIDLSRIWVDGTNSGDKIIISWELR